jgi:hypothetical protein
LDWWVNMRLSDMFDYRHRVTQQNCERIKPPVASFMEQSR